MNLWIRSQDQTQLVKAEGIKYEKVPVGHSILVPYEFGVYNVGQYESKERVLEILDEIQELIKPNFKINYEYDDNQPIMNGEWFKSLKAESKIEELSCYVYEMPKE